MQKLDYLLKKKKPGQSLCNKSEYLSISMQIKYSCKNTLFYKSFQTTKGYFKTKNYYLITIN